MGVFKKNGLRICMVSDQLSVGGAERYAAFLSQYFENNQVKVHHVIVVDSIEYEYSGELLNLGKLKNRSNGLLNRLQRFWVLYRFFAENDFDYIIDFRVKNRQWQEYFIAKFIYRSPLIVVVQNYITDLYFPKNKFLANAIYSHAYKIITVSHKIKEKILTTYSYKNIGIIYNPLDTKKIREMAETSLGIDYKYIVAVGRMENNVKQIDKLIRCYARSVLPTKGIKLVVLGEGKLRQGFAGLAKTLGLENNVIFEGHVDNPFQYYRNAQFMVLSSLNEGLPFVLIESLICGTPVVSFDCPSGPSEIIRDRQNGILVEDQNEGKLTEAMDLLIEDEKLYQHCKQNASASVAQFDMEIIGKQWLELVKNTVS